MGSGSDFTAFQDFAGIPSLDMGFGYGRDSAVYHYHSNYDSFDWMEKYGDPGFEYHATIAKIWALVAAKLIETPVVQLNATEYALGLNGYVNGIKKKAKNAGFGEDNEDNLFKSLDDAIKNFQVASKFQDGTASQLLRDLFDNDIPWWNFWEKLRLYYAVRKVNTKYKLLERKFLFADGLDERPWFKHVVFAPGKWTGYSGATFPGIVEGIEEGKLEVVEKWIAIVAERINGAAFWLLKD
jgi:N-acetylated-alpha-linked acidic dipeptidase